MSFKSKTLLHHWAQKPLSHRSLLIAAAASAFENTAVGKAVGAQRFDVKY